MSRARLVQVWRLATGRQRLGRLPLVVPTVGVDVEAPVARRLSVLLCTGVGVPLLRPIFRAGAAQFRGWPVVVRVLVGIAVHLGYTARRA